jgi:multidrug efflux pump
VIIFRQPGANIIDTVDRIRAALPSLKASMPAGHRLQIVMDRTLTIRASVHDVERTLVISIGLVILVVFFLRNVRATLHPQRGRAGVADRHLRGDVPVRLQHRQLVADGADHLHRVRGGRRHRGDREHHALHRAGNVADGSRAKRGAQEIGFTVLSISLSLSPCSFRFC